MKCQLLTSAKEFVAEVEIPPFNTPPDILVWGERFFKLDQATTRPEYVEAFTYFVLPAKAVAE